MRETCLRSIFMLDCAEERLNPASYVRFTEQYKKLSAEGFGTEEKNALSSIKHYETEIKALEAVSWSRR